MKIRGHNTELLCFRLEFLRLLFGRLRVAPSAWASGEHLQGISAERLGARQRLFVSARYRDMSS